MKPDLETFVLDTNNPDWSRYPGWAVLIWESMLNLFILVRPSGYNHTADIE